MRLIMFARCATSHCVCLISCLSLSPEEDMFFDRYLEVAGRLTQAIRERPAGTSAVRALRDTS